MPAPTYGVIELATGERVVIDCTLVENITREADVTEYPVESGSTISDNIRARPLQLHIEGIISNSPIVPIASIRVEGVPPAKEMRERLERAFETKDVLTVIVSTGKYTSMAMESLEFPRDATTGDALRFNARFKQITIVTNARVLVKKTAIRTGGGKVKRGGQPVLFKLSKAVIWNKGIIYKFASNKKFDAAGAPQFVYSGGAPDIGDTEVVYWVDDPESGFWVHQDQKTPLTDSETRRLKLDLDRDYKRLRPTPPVPGKKLGTTVLPEYDQALKKYLKPVDLNATNKQGREDLPPHLRAVQPLPEGFKL
jgi:hypothetical protein